MNPDGTPFTRAEYEAYVNGHGKNWTWGARHTPARPVKWRYTLSDQQSGRPDL